MRRAIGEIALIGSMCESVLVIIMVLLGWPDLAIYFGVEIGLVLLIVGVVLWK